MLLLLLLLHRSNVASGGLLRLLLPQSRLQIVVEAAGNGANAGYWVFSLVPRHCNCLLPELSATAWNGHRCDANIAKRLTFNRKNAERVHS